MAYYSSSNNYDQHHDNYQYYQPYNYNSHDELRYVQNYNYNDDYIEYNHYNNNNNNNNNYINSYELTPTKSLVGCYYSNYSNNNNNDYNYNNNYNDDVNQHDFFASKNANFSKNGDYFYDPVTTRFIISYNNVSNEINDLDFEEYDPEPFVGGYDICATYGKPLPPSDDICYKMDANHGTNNGDQTPAGGEKPDTSSVQEEGNEVIDPGDKKDDGKQNIVENVGGLGPKPDSVPEGSVIDSEEDEDEDEEEDEGVVNGNVVPLVTQEVIDSKTEGTDEKNQGNLEGDEVKIRRQIPPGYGIEAMGICDGLFGGYFPCLSKKNYINCYACGGEVKSKVIDEYECWQGTVDYLFGNPNPYGGAMPEKGSYGDPVYAYQRHCPQMSVVGKFVNEETSSSSVYSSGYNYGYNNGGY